MKKIQNWLKHVWFEIELSIVNLQNRMGLI